MSQNATFAAGCFWGIESAFRSLHGVIDARVGYIGGRRDKPTYEQVCTGVTGHAEAVEVTFDPSVISYETLLDTFWRMHNPTQFNRQGPDVGTQYRSAIFYHGEAQHQAALKSKDAAQNQFKTPIVTEITPAVTFWPAEEYHQRYNEKNGRACHF